MIRKAKAVWRGTGRAGNGTLQLPDDRVLPGELGENGGLPGGGGGRRHRRSVN